MRHRSASPITGEVSSAAFRRLFTATLVLLLISVVAAPARSRSSASAWAPTLPATFGNNNSLSAFADGSGFAFDDGWDYVYVSGDHGLTWAPSEIPATRTGAVYEMANPEVGYFWSSGGFFKTTDGTNSWDAIQDPPLPGPDYFDQFKTGKGWSYGLSAMDAARDGRLMVLGGNVHYFEDNVADCIGPQRATIWTSRSGKRWHRTSFDHPGHVRKISFLNERVGIALVLRYGPSGRSDQFQCESKEAIVYRTTDGGRTFDEVISRSFDKSEPAAFTSIGIASRSTFVAGAADGSIVRTVDGGRTFRSGPPLVNPVTANAQTPADRIFWVTGFDFASGSVGYATTKGGGTWRTQDAGRTWKLETSTEVVFSRIGFGDVAAGDEEHAISAGGTSILTRVP